MIDATDTLHYATPYYPAYNGTTFYDYEHQVEQLASISISPERE